MNNRLPGVLICLSCSVLSVSVQQANGSQVSGTITPTTTKQAAKSLPGVTWESLKALPQLIGSQWLPDNTPADEATFLRGLVYPPLQDEPLLGAKAMVQSMRHGDAVLPTHTCRYDGMPRAVWYPYPIQFVYAAGNVMIQTHDVIRAAAINGLKHSSELRDKQALQSLDMYGEAVAEWQGDTLVIDTIGVREDIDTFYGVPNDPDLHVIERYQLQDDGKLQRIVTIEAPTYLKQPWEIRTTYTRAPEASWATRFCLTGDKSQDGAQ